MGNCGGKYFSLDSLYSHFALRFVYNSLLIILEIIGGGGGLLYNTELGTKEQKLPTICSEVTVNN